MDRTEPSAYDKRVGELYRMNKGALARRWREVNPDTIWTATPPERWSKDELISGILEAERPARAAVSVPLEVFSSPVDIADGRFIAGGAR